MARIWTQQPSCQAQVREGYSNFNAAADIAYGAYGGGAQSYLIARRHGAGLVCGQYYGFLTDQAKNLLASNKFTLAIAGTQDAATTGRHIVSFGGSVNTLGFHDNAFIIGGYGLSGTSVSLPARTVGKEYTSIAVYDGATITVYENGAQVGQSTVTGSITSNPTILAYGNMPGYSYGSDVSILDCFLLDSAMSADDAKWLSLSPDSIWQIFKPRNDEVFGISSGTTLALSTNSGNSAGSSAALTVPVLPATSASNTAQSNATLSIATALATNAANQATSSPALTIASPLATTASNAATSTPSLAIPVALGTNSGNSATSAANLSIATPLATNSGNSATSSANLTAPVGGAISTNAGNSAGSSASLTIATQLQTSSSNQAGSSAVLSASIVLGFDGLSLFSTIDWAGESMVSWVSDMPVSEVSTITGLSSSFSVIDGSVFSAIAPIVSAGLSARSSV